MDLLSHSRTIEEVPVDNSLGNITLATIIVQHKYATLVNAPMHEGIYSTIRTVISVPFPMLTIGRTDPPMYLVRTPHCPGELERSTESPKESLEEYLSLCDEEEKCVWPSPMLSAVASCSAKCTAFFLAIILIAWSFIGATLRSAVASLMKQVSSVLRLTD